MRTNPFWRGSFKARRCLVPASSLCEPNSDVKPATWNWFALKDSDDPRPLFAFLGIRRRYKGLMKKDAPVAEIETYSFLTTTLSPLVATINHERMPVLLTQEEGFETWLSSASTTCWSAKLWREPPLPKRYRSGSSAAPGPARPVSRPVAGGVRRLPG